MTASDLSDPQVNSHLTELVIDVLGVPVPQGSKTVVMRAGRPVLIDANANALKAWRRTVTRAAAARMALVGWSTVDAPVRVVIEAWFPRPKSVRRELPSVKPDVDKVARALLDGCTDAGVWTDDARVVELVARKHYAVSLAGARVLVRPVTDEEEQR